MSATGESRLKMRSRPFDLAVAAAADAGRQARKEESPDNVAQIGRRRLLMPILRKRRRMRIVGKERPVIHNSASG
jgi:hypothetical protein